MSLSLKIHRGGETDIQRQKERHTERERRDTQAKWALQKLSSKGAHTASNGDTW